MIKKLLKPAVIKLNTSVPDWEAAVRQSVELLVNIGAVEPRYVEASVDMVREMGPYMVIAPGLALAHARPESGVIRNCLGLLTLATPVEFGNPDNDPVDIIFSLGAIESDEHIKLMSDLARFLMNKKTLPALRRASSAREVTEIIQ